MNNRESRILGIDFGTTYTAAATIIDGRVSFVVDGGEAMIPSLTYLPPRGDPVVGRNAIPRLIADPRTTISSIKRLLGRTFSDREVRAIDAGVGYRIKQGPNGAAVLQIGSREYACEQIVAIILKRVRQLAENRFGRTITKAIIGVPATATPEYIRALRRSAKLARLELLQVIPEPIAGALASGIHLAPAKRRLAICDFGGGTFDVSLIEQEGQSFSPIGTSGDSFLGGDDFDHAFAKAVSGVVYKSSGCEMENNAVSWRQLIVRCESVKRMLSTQTEAPLTMNDAYVAEGKRGNINLLVDRTWIEPKWKNLTDRSTSVIRSLMQSCDWTADDVDKVVMIGGTSMVPLVQRSYRSLFTREKLMVNEWASLAVATGLALQTQAHQPITTNAPALSSQ